MSREARIHQLLANRLNGGDIEAMSFATIDRLAPSHGFSPEQWNVVRRMIHTTGDFSIMEAVQFSPGAVGRGIEALKAGRPLCVDSNMIRAGLSAARLRTASARYRASDVHCHVADHDVAQEATQQSLPRSVLAVRKVKSLVEGAIAVFGNAPTGLLELNRLMIEEGVRPALVVAMPVGFVHVEESKRELMELGVPYIMLAGRRGGSPLAVSVVHALCSLAATEQPEPQVPRPSAEPFDAVILLGHGSRVPGADRNMLRVAEALRSGGRYVNVEACNMSRLGPHFDEVFENCVRLGARRVLLLPYFLNEGLHMKRDIPAKMQESVKRHRDVELVFGKHLGFDHLLVELTERRIEESAALEDVRQFPVPDEGTYPVPHGQCEFVPMLPEEAARWRQMQSTSRAPDGHGGNAR